MNVTPLTTIEPKTEVCVDHLAVSGADRIRLQRLGICDGKRIFVAQSGDPLIVCAVRCRIGISRRLAENVFVRKT